MPNILSQIVEDKYAEVSARKLTCSPSEMQRGLTPAKGTFLPALHKEGICIIGEIKPKSPSAGQLTASVDLEYLATIYSNQAAAISVLTDRKYFGGSLAALQEVSAKSSVPTLCKDFILDEYQVQEARRAGAEAVLLIVKILKPNQLALLHNAITALNMVPVVEVQTEGELETALTLDPKIILVNNRNLDTFEIDLATSERLIPKIPPGIMAISASGIENTQDIVRLQHLTKVFLVGSSLMKAADIEVKLRSLRNPFLVKICGITSAIDASAAVSLGADLVGIIFAENSPRRVSAEQAKYICQAVGGEKVVGVFQNQSVQEIWELRESLGFRYVQLHGQESPDVARALNPCLKAITVFKPDDVKQAQDYAQYAEYVLFDRPKGLNALQWIADTIDSLNRDQPISKFLLAGGLAPSNVRQSIDSIVSPNLVGVDVATGTECAPGVKDIRLVRKFLLEAKGNAVTR